MHRCAIRRCLHRPAPVPPWIAHWGCLMACVLMVRKAPRLPNQVIDPWLGYVGRC